MANKQAQTIPVPRKVVLLRELALPAVALALLTTIVFWQVLFNDFLSYDDPLYVTENPFVQSGLSWTGVKGAFTSIVASNWQPITLLSHELDVSLFGKNPGGHHASSLCLHVFNVVLLFVALTVLTRERGQSAFVAALFAVHPLHVESVAWVSSRKDLLSTFFLFVALIAYALYCQSQKKSHYRVLLAAFALGLMAKSMLMTLPFVLLLLDYWPLKRIDFANARWRETAKALVREKIPLFGLTALIVLIAFYTQHQGKALQDVTVYTPYARVTNAIVSYASYALRIVVPYPLAVFYPHPESSLALWKIGLSLLGLVAFTVVVLRRWRTRPHLAVGWFWYLGMLVPVVGFVQIGGQAMADRYTYVTLIGLFIVIVWEAALLTPSRWRGALAIAGIVVLVPLVLRTQSYLRYWRDSETLFRETLRVTERNYPAHINLGCALADRGDMAEAEVQFEAATQIVPASVEGWYNLGSARMLQNKFGGAVDAYRKALDISPYSFDTRLRLAKSLAGLGRIPEALQEAEKAIALNPNSAEAHALAKQLAGNAK